MACDGWACTRQIHRLKTITTSVSGFTYRRYELIYGAPSADSGRSLLREIQQFGAGANPGPPRTSEFSYRSNVADGTEGWERVVGSGWESAPDFVRTDNKDAGVRIGDVDGDGLPDIVRGVIEFATQRADADSGVFFNNGSGFGTRSGQLPDLEFTYDAEWLPPGDPSKPSVGFANDDGKSFGSVLADLDGDGKAEILVAREQLSRVDGQIARDWFFSMYENVGNCWSPWPPRRYQWVDPETIDGAALAGTDVLEDDGAGGFTNYLPRHSLAIWNQDVASPDWTVTAGRSLLADLDGDGAKDLLTHGQHEFSEQIFPIENDWFGNSNHYDLVDYDDVGPLSDRFQICTDPGEECLFHRATAFHKSAFDLLTQNGLHADTFWRWGKRLVDLNGDGLADFIASVQRDLPGHSSIQETHLDQGADFVLSPAWTLPVVLDHETLALITRDRGVRFADVNGDGRPDIVRAQDLARELWINTGDPTAPWAEAAQSSPWQVPGAGHGVGPFGFSFVSSLGVDNGVRFMDLNGDGMVDLIRSYAGIVDVFLNRGRVPDLLTQVTEPFGAIVTFDYTPSTASPNDNPKLGRVLQLVGAIHVDSGAGGVETRSYRYSDGRFWNGREFLGFGEVVETREGDGRTVIRAFHASPSGWERAGLPISVEARDQEENTWRKAQYWYWGTNPRLLQQIDIEEWDGGATPRRTRQTFDYDRSLGVLMARTDFGEVSPSATGSDLDPLDTRTTQIEYDLSPDPTNDLPYLVDRPSLVRLRSGADPSSGNVIRETRLAYDEGSAVRRGELTSVVTLLDLAAGTGPKTSFEYDDFGNLIEIIGPRVDVGEISGTTVLEYDLASLHAFPTALTNALGHRTEFGHAAAPSAAWRTPLVPGWFTPKPMRTRAPQASPGPVATTLSLDQFSNALRPTSPRRPGSTTIPPEASASPRRRGRMRREGLAC